MEPLVALDPEVVADLVAAHLDDRTRLVLDGPAVMVHPVGLHRLVGQEPAVGLDGDALVLEELPQRVD